MSDIQLTFSEAMESESALEIQIEEFKNGNQTEKNSMIEISNPKWSNGDKTLHLKIETEFEEFAIILNWWGSNKPIISKNGILVEPQSYILLKK